MKLYLVGYMACGKSTIGKRLARELGYKFVDTDHLIQQRMGCSISELIERSSLERFRELESEALELIKGEDMLVVATGGGLPCWDDNMERINRDGISIYIKMDNKTLLNRIVNSKSERPLVKGKNLEELEQFIADSMIQREPYYNKAKITISGIGLTPQGIIESIKNIDTH